MIPLQMRRDIDDPHPRHRPSHPLTYCQWNPPAMINGTTKTIVSQGITKRYTNNHCEQEQVHEHDEGLAEKRGQNQPKMIETMRRRDPGIVDI